MKLIFKSQGETPSSIKDLDYLKKGSIFDKIETLNEDFIDPSNKGQAVLNFSFKRLGFYFFQVNLKILTFNNSICSLYLINNDNEEKTLILKAYNSSEAIKNFIINHKNLNYSYSFLLENNLGKCQECRISNTDIYFQDY